MQTPLKGLLFDNDGVLVDSMPGALQAWVSWGERYHQDFVLSAEYHGRRASDIVAELVSEDKFHDALDYINQLELDQLPLLSEPLSFWRHSLMALGTS